MPPLPDSFHFSQASLQDFLDCQRRFELRHRVGLRWPAVEAEPIEAQERRMILGKAFHQLVQQHMVGVPEARIERASRATEMAPDLARWWDSYRAYRPVELFGGRDNGAYVRSEYALEGVSAGHRLVVRYDLLVLVPGERAVILDWKTSARRAREQDLRGHMQTRVYRFLLVQAGHELNGGTALEPEQVEMVYWFPEFPDAPARFPYDGVQYAEDEVYLARLIGRIVGMNDGDFAMTEDEQKCRFCTYRSYCDRGIKAGTLEDVTAAWELQAQGENLDINLEQVAEIEY